MKASVPPIAKPVSFEGTSQDDLREFPKDIRNEAGYGLDRVQRGLDPINWKPLSTVGTGVKEIRVTDTDGWYRVVYVAKLKSAVYVLHAFSKKTNSTSKADIDLAKARLKSALSKDRAWNEKAGKDGGK